MWFVKKTRRITSEHRMAGRNFLDDIPRESEDEEQEDQQEQQEQDDSFIDDNSEEHTSGEGMRPGEHDVPSQNMNAYRGRHRSFHLLVDSAPADLRVLRLHFPRVCRRGNNGQPSWFSMSFYWLHICKILGLRRRHESPIAQSAPKALNCQLTRLTTMWFVKKTRRITSEHMRPGAMELDHKEQTLVAALALGTVHLYGATWDIKFCSPGVELSHLVPLCLHNGVMIKAHHRYLTSMWQRSYSARPERVCTLNILGRSLG